MIDVSDWEGDVVLADGATVHMREMCPADEPMIAGMYERLSADSVYYRFFSPVPRATATSLELHKLGEPGHVARVAVLGNEIVAAARYDVVKPGEAEVAFVVADEHQGRGVGTLLLEHLAVIARAQGIHTFAADTLPDNGKMLGMFAAAGWARESRFDAGTVRTRFAIAPSREATAATADREHVAESASMARLLAPRAIAVIGASREAGKIGHAVMQNLLGQGFNGVVYPVNPNAASVAGIPAYASVSDIDGPVDLVVVARPASDVIDIVDECARKQVHGLVILSAGFAETGDEGAGLERAVVAKARANGMRVVGPNCLGIANTAPSVRMNATFAPVPLVEGNVAFLSQSGGLGNELLSQAAARGIGISEFVSVGNKSDVSGNDLLQYWEDDPRTAVILLYLESFGNPRKFARIARRISRHKPIVVVKSGRDPAVDALFRQAGVIRVDTFEELLDTAQMLSAQPIPQGPRVAIVGNAGGPGMLASDACAGAGLRVDGLSAPTQAGLRELAAPGATTHNPVDLGASATPEQFARALPVVLADDAVDAVIVVYAPPVVTDARAVARAIADSIAAAASSKPIVACFLGRLDVADELRGDGAARRTVPTFGFPEAASRALGRAVELSAWRARPEGVVPELADIDVEAARTLIADRLLRGGEGAWLDDADADALLRAFGIPTVVARRMPDESAPASEAGMEVVVGVTQDALFGPLLLFGLGGVTAELLADRSLRILPVTDEDARELVRSLRSSPLLFGYRGTPALDVVALEDLIVRVARLGHEVPEITEIDLDPIIVREQGVLVHGARVRCAAAPHSMPPELRRMRG